MMTLEEPVDAFFEHCLHELEALLVLLVDVEQVQGQPLQARHMLPKVIELGFVSEHVDAGRAFERERYETTTHELCVAREAPAVVEDERVGTLAVLGGHCHFVT